MPMSRQLENKCQCGEGGSLTEVAMPLSAAGSGKKLKVERVSGERHICSRMAAMGIYPGVEMELICAGRGAPCVVRVHGGTLSLGSGVSDTIFVTGDMS